MTSVPAVNSTSNPTWLRLRSVQYAIAGLLVGALFPVIAISVEIVRLHLPLSLSSIQLVQYSEPLLWIIETAPIFLGAAAALTGRRQDQVLQNNKVLRDQAAELQTVRSGLEQIVSQRTHELDERNAHMGAVIQFARHISEFQDLQTLLSTAAQSLAERFNWHDVDVYLLDEGGQSATLRASASQSSDDTQRHGRRISISDQDAVGRAIKRGRTFVLASHSDPNRQSPERSKVAFPGTQVSLPLIAHGRVLGALHAHTQDSRAISQNEIEIFQLATDQLAVAIENVRLVMQAQATADQLMALTTHDTQSAWQHYLKNREFSYHYTPSGNNPMSEPPSSNGKGWLSIPLALRGQKIGTITLNKGIGGSWTLTDRDLLERVATQAVLALENARLLDETRQRAAREQVVSEISVRLNRSLEVDAVLQSAAREFAALPEVAEAEVILASAVLEKDSDHG